MGRLRDFLTQPVDFQAPRTRRVALLAAAAVAILAIVIAVASTTGHHHRHPASTGAVRRAEPIASTTTTGTTPWSASQVAPANAGPAAVTPAAQQFVLSYVAFLRHQASAAAVANASPALRSKLEHQRAAAIPVTGALQITGLHTDKQAADGTVTVIAQVQAGETAFGVEIQMLQQDGRWVASSIPSTQGSF